MQAQEMGVILKKHAEQMTAKGWAELVEQLEKKGLYVLIESETNGRVMSPLGGLMPMPCKDQRFIIVTAEELEQKGMSIGHHVIAKSKEKTATVSQ